jgi:hypothetical protein
MIEKKILVSRVYDTERAATVACNAAIFELESKAIKWDLCTIEPETGYFWYIFPYTEGYRYKMELPYNG